MPKHGVRSIERVKVPDPPVSPTKKMVLLIDSTVKVNGVYSGRSYTFHGAGSVQDVDERDVESLLEKRQGRRQCCGGSPEGNVVFQLAGDN